VKSGIAQTGKAVLRWSVVAACGGFGLAALLSAVTVLWSAVRQGRTDFIGGVFVFALLAICAGFFLRVAFLTVRGRYREVCDLLAALASVAVFTAVLILPGEFVVRALRNPAIEGLFGLPTAVALLFAPFVAFLGARWVNDHLRTILHRFVHDFAESPRSAKPFSD
jgi:hypothetical protein